MQNLATKYGNYISSLIQASMYYFAGKYLVQEYFNTMSSFAENITLLFLIILPLSVVKYCETKFASKFISD